MKQFKVGERVTALRSRTSNIYFTEVAALPMLSPAKEAEIAYRAREGDKEAIDLLVKSNLRFVISVAKMYDNAGGRLLEDLIAVGNSGLIEAAHKFDPSRGFKFISFAVWYIRKDMLKYLNDHGHIAKIPITHKRIQRKAKEISGAIFTEEGREPTDQEILERLRKTLKNLGGLQMEVMKAAMSVGEHYASLDAPASEDGDLTLADLLADPDSDNDSEHREEMNLSLQELLSCLTPLERVVIEKRYLSGSSEYPEYSSIALAIGSDVKSVQATAGRAFRKLQRYSTYVSNPFKS